MGECKGSAEGRLVGEVGTVIHATLKTDDLLDAFAGELERLCGEDKAHLALAQEARWWAEAVREDWLNDEGHAQAGMLLNEDMFDALEAYAPEGCYFGAHEGDGSDFGYWPFGKES